MTERGDPSRGDQAVSDTSPAARIPQAALEPAPPPVRGVAARVGPPLVVLALGALLISNVAAWVEIDRLKGRSSVAVIAVRQLTDDYLHRLSTLPVTSDEAARIGAVFAMTAQEEAVKAGGRRRLVLARECVISGDADDLTTMVSAAVERRMHTLTAAIGSGPPSPPGAFERPLTGAASPAPKPR